MAKIQIINPEFNIWEIVRLSGVSPVIPDVSYTLENGELTVENVTQAALELALTEYDHVAYLEEIKPKKTELELLQEENKTLKIRVQTAEQVAAETSTTVEGLLELLVDLEVIV